MVDKITVPVWLIPKREALDKLVKQGVKIPSVVTEQFKSYATSGSGYAKGASASIARGIKEGSGPGQMSWFEKNSLIFQKDGKKLALATAGVLGGIAYSLAKVPSILQGSLKMLSFGFLLILKPLADLLAMVLLPIASLVLKLAAWMNKVAGGSLIGMISMAVLGLILAVIAGLSIIAGAALISSALTSLIVGAIGSITGIALGGASISEAITLLATKALASPLALILGGAIIAGAISGLIVNALGATPLESIVTGLGGIILTAVGILLGAPLWAAIAAGIITAVAGWVGYRSALSGYENAQAGKGPGSMLEAINPLDQVGRDISAIKDTIYGKPSSQSSPVINITVNGNGDKYLADIVSKNVTQALNRTGSIRQGI